MIDGKPIYRVRVRRILEMEGAERRGIAITRRISKKFENNGLITVPDFQSAWIDSLVNIMLADENVSQSDAVTHPICDSQDSSLAQAIADPDAMDLSEDEEGLADNGTAPVAEPLHSPAGDAGVIEVPVVSTIDAIIRVSSIPSANRGVVSVLSTDDISKATTLMRFDGYSQLAIMQGAREARGMITWESIAKRSMLSPKPTSVADCRIDAQVIDSDASLFDAFPVIEKFGYVLARSKDKTITGIITSTDFASELRQLSYGFMCLRTIEMLIRKKLHPKLTSQDLTTLEEHSKAREECDPALLTFGENIRLLEHSDIWERLGLAIYKNEFIKRLREVRDIRNEIMHFGPDPLDTEQKKSLNQMEYFLQQVFA